MANTQRPTASKQQATSLSGITEQATPAEVVVPVCVAGKLVAEYERLDRELEALQDQHMQESPKLTGGGSTPEEDKIVRRMRTLKPQIKAQTHDFVFHKLGDNKWPDLIDEHGPRSGRERQERWNPHTFPPAAVRASCVSPDGMDDEEAFRKFWDGVLNDGQRDDLFRGAQRANEVALSVPFSVSESAHRLSSEQSSTT